jgi:hypothetical protein
MGEHHISIAMTFESNKPTTDDYFEAFLDCVMEELDKIDRDVSMAARLGERLADFATVVEAADFETAAQAFLGDIRTALHAAGCGTSGWEFTATERVVRELADA